MAARRSIQVSKIVNQSGVSLLVSGLYMPPIPARLTADPYDSEECIPGYWVEYAISIGGVEVTEFLEWISMSGGVDRILDKAVEVL